jgi:SAM-dependent methyltransferase
MPRLIAESGELGFARGTVVRSHDDSGYNVYAATREAILTDAEYAFHIAQNYLLQFENSGLVDVAGKRVLEIGPGTNLGTAFIFKALGATEVHVVDRFLSRFDPDYHPVVYRILKTMTKETYPLACLDIFDQCIAAGAHEAEGLHCHVTGMENMSTIASSSINITLSNVVFEHLADPAAAFQELARISAPSAIGSHQVDFRYHVDFSRPLEFLLMDEEEQKAFTSGCHYTCGNGWRPREYRELFIACGFEILSESPNMFAEDAYMDDFMARLRESPSRYRSFTREELREVSSHFLIRKTAGFTLPSWG